MQSLVTSMIANLDFFKPNFEILAFFDARGFFYFSQNLAVSFFQSERLSSGKTLSELHIHYKSLLTRVYDHCRVQRLLQRFYCCPKNF